MRIYDVVIALQDSQFTSREKWLILLDYMNDVNSGRISWQELPIMSSRHGHA